MPFPAVLIVSITVYPLLYMFCLKKNLKITHCIVNNMLRLKG